jgi:hypothetical protein
MAKILRILLCLCLTALFSGELAFGEVIVFFRNDDISAKSDPEFEYRILEVFHKHKITPLYAVIPSLSGQTIGKEMPIAIALKTWHNNGWLEIGMHGFDHQLKN